MTSASIHSIETEKSAAKVDRPVPKPGDDNAKAAGLDSNQVKEPEVKVDRPAPKPGDDSGNIPSHAWRSCSASERYCRLP
jgi:hypothetical protein